MNGRQIEIFNMVMQARTVSEAAERLGISQPAVTASIKQMEHSIGFNLFHRTGGRLHPTQQARILNDEAERVHDSLAIFRKLADRLRSDLTQHLRVISPPAFSHALLPNVVAEFLQHTPDCMVDVTTRHQSQILADLSDTAHKNNLGFSFGIDEHPGLGTTHIGTTDILAMVPKAWKIPKSPALALQDLAPHPFINTFTGEPLGNAVQELYRTHGVKPRFSARVRNHIFAAELANRGVGIALIDGITADYQRTINAFESVTIVKLHDAPSLPITAVFPYDQALNNHARQFIGLFRAAFKKSAQDLAAALQ